MDDNAQSCDKLLICFFAELREEILSDQIEGGLRLAADYFRLFSRSITDVHCACRVARPGIVNDKNYDFRRAGISVLAESAAGNLSYVTVEHVPRCAEAFVAFDWDLYFSVGRSGKTGLTACRLGIDCGVIGDAAQGRTAGGVLGLCKTMSELINAQYGFVTIMPRIYLPTGYAAGLAGRAPRKLVWDANSWRRGAWKHFSTRLRNVFGMNFVGPEHLLTIVNGENLRDWISADRGRGEVSAWENGLHLWSFAGCDSWPRFLQWGSPAVIRTRSELERHHLFPWQEFIARFPGTRAGPHASEDA